MAAIRRHGHGRHRGSVPLQFAHLAARRDIPDDGLAIRTKHYVATVRRHRRPTVHVAIHRKPLGIHPGPILRPAHVAAGHGVPYADDVGIRIKQKMGTARHDNPKRRIQSASLEHVQFATCRDVPDADGAVM